MLAVLSAVALVAASDNCSTFTTNTTCSCNQAVSFNQVHKNPRPIEYRGALDRRLHPSMSESEWEDRVELAALARIMYIYGFGSDLAAQCVMARLRDQPDHMIMNECACRRRREPACILCSKAACILCPNAACAPTDDEPAAPSPSQGATSSKRRPPRRSSKSGSGRARHLRGCSLTARARRVSPRRMWSTSGVCR